MRKLWNLVLLACLMVSTFGNSAAFAQAQTSSDWAWKPVVLHDSVSVEYLFYSEVGERRSGVVLKVVNRSAEPHGYAMTVIFKSGDDRVEVVVSGCVDANSLVTGEADGLFFLPFKDGRPVGEIGLRGYRIGPCVSDHSASGPSTSGPSTFGSVSPLRYRVDRRRA